MRAYCTPPLKQLYVYEHNVSICLWMVIPKSLNIIKK